jgi:hypothetical protein
MKTIPWQWYCEKCGAPSFVGEIPAHNKSMMGNFLVSWFKGLCPKCATEGGQNELERSKSNRSLGRQLQ